jgi:predicted amidohydrolase YtcJ
VTPVPTADLILNAQSVHTMSGADAAPVTSVAVRDGIILDVGDRQAVDAYRGSKTEVIDLGAATLTPGLIDGHLHPVHGTKLTIGADLTGVTSVPELVAAVRDIVPDRGWIRGWGLNPSIFGERAITHEPIIEAVGPDVPVFIVMYDAHSAIVSPAALAAAGVTGPREFNSHAMFACDAAGLPTGHVIEFEAMAVIEEHLPSDTAEAHRGRLLAILQAMADAGITAGNAMDFGHHSGDLVASLEASGELPIRLRFAPWCMPADGPEYVEHLIDTQRLSGRRWKVDGVKFFLDGTVEGGTAWLTHADSCGESTAPGWPELDKYDNAIRRLDAAGVPTATHAIGDAAVRHALATLARLPMGRVRHRIEHIESIPHDVVEQFAKSGAAASMQPRHCTGFVDPEGADTWSRRLGPERAGRAFCTRDLRKAGVVLALGSDWPVAPFDPRMIMADAQLRRPAGQPEAVPVVREQGLTARMALEGYTTHAARANGETSTAGVIAPGYRADFTAFAVDPLAAPPDELADAPIELTVVAGHVVARRNI